MRILIVSQYFLQKAFRINVAAMNSINLIGKG